MLEEGWGYGIVRELERDTYTLLYLKWIINKDLTISHMELCLMVCGRLDGMGVWERRDT